MKYNFDQVIDRNGTDAVKLDGLKELWGRTDLIPLWVADMDFATAPFILDAIKNVVRILLWGIHPSRIAIFNLSSIG